MLDRLLRARGAITTGLTIWVKMANRDDLWCVGGEPGGGHGPVWEELCAIVYG